MKKILALAVFILVFSCEKKQDKSGIVSVDTTEASNSKLETNDESLSKEATLKEANDELIKALKVEDYNTLANYIHPQKGVRFSMYTFVNPKKDIFFLKADLQKFENY